MPNRNALAERIRVILKGRSQAELARRTASTGASVNRYLAGTRVPADFCIAMVEQFGVNPHWLLTGKGVPYSAEIAASGEQLAGSLLELVEAMENVARMRLGAVTGQGRTLRGLADATRRYGELRERLNAHSRPVLKRLLSDLEHKMARRNTDEAEGLINTAEEVAKFCDDPALRVALDSFRAEHAYLCGRREEALRLQEDVVMRMLLSHGVRDEGTFLQVFNLASALNDRRRYRDARRITGAALALADDAEPRWRALPLLRCMLGQICVELGEMDRGISLMHRGLAQLPDVDPPVQIDTIRYQRTHLERAQLLSGALPLSELLARKDYKPWHFYSATLMALWLEDPMHLQLLAKDIPEGDRTPDVSARIVLGAARAFNGALQGQGRNALARLRQTTQPAVIQDPAPFQEFLAHALCAQVTLAAGNNRAAKRYAEQAANMLASLEPGLVPPLEVRAIHYRTLRRLGHDAGNDFFEKHLAAGYLCLRHPA